MIKQPILCYTTVTREGVKYDIICCAEATLSSPATGPLYSRGGLMEEPAYGNSWDFDIKDIDLDGYESDPDVPPLSPAERAEITLWLTSLEGRLKLSELADEALADANALGDYSPANDLDYSDLGGFDDE